MEAALALLTLQNSWDSCKDWGHGEPQGRGFSWEVRPPAPLPGREALLCQTPPGPPGPILQEGSPYRNSGYHSLTEYSKALL